MSFAHIIVTYKPLFEALSSSYNSTKLFDNIVTLKHECLSVTAYPFTTCNSRTASFTDRNSDCISARNQAKRQFSCRVRFLKTRKLLLAEKSLLDVRIRRRVSQPPAQAAR